MTRGDPAAAGEPADQQSSRGQLAESSAWAPLRQRVFRLLWFGVLISWTGTWMQTVGAQWLLVEEPNSAALVSLVQVASTLPLMLLALPGGVLADPFDRRRLLITVQAYLFVVAILLTVLTAAGGMPPMLLLGFTFALGLGAAVQMPTWQAMMPELVPRTQLRAAAGLDLVSVNLAYAVGPVLAGLAIVYLGGVPVVSRSRRQRWPCSRPHCWSLACLRRRSDLAGSGSSRRSVPVVATSGQTRRPPHHVPRHRVRRAGDGAVCAAAVDR